MEYYYYLLFTRHYIAVMTVFAALVLLTLAAFVTASKKSDEVLAIQGDRSVFTIVDMKPIMETAPLPDSEPAEIYAAPIDRDFQDILERGVITLITDYSVSAYFLQNGLDRGFEFEFFASFARKHDLNIEVNILKPGDDPVEILNRGEGDIIASNFFHTPSRNKRVFLSEPYNVVNMYIILPEGRDDVVTPEDLADVPISVREDSAEHELLRGLIAAGRPYTLDIIPETIDKEALMIGVAGGRYQAAVLGDNQYNTIKSYVTGIRKGPRLMDSLPVSWAVRENAGKLQDEVNHHIYGNFKQNPDDGTFWRSGYLTMLNNRYFNNQIEIEGYRRSIHQLMYDGVISPYDHLIKPVAESANVDWKLAAAVMAQESSFRPDAISFAGAVGLMQIIPRFSQVTDEAQLLDPKTNIREGIRYLQKHLAHYAYLDNENQLALTLATYNAGVGHVSDARRIAIDYNKDPNEWNAVADALLKLMDRRYYNRARYGYCRGTETVEYVQRVMSRYKIYQSAAELAGQNGRGEVEEAILAMGRI